MWTIWQYNGNKWRYKRKSFAGLSNLKDQSRKPMWQLFRLDEQDSVWDYHGQYATLKQLRRHVEAMR